MYYFAIIEKKIKIQCFASGPAGLDMFFLACLIRVYFSPCMQVLYRDIICRRAICKKNYRIFNN